MNININRIKIKIKIRYEENKKEIRLIYPHSQVSLLISPCLAHSLLSYLALKLDVLFASTSLDDNLFHFGTTLWVNQCFLIFSLEYFLYTFLECDLPPKVAIWKKFYRSTFSLPEIILYVSITSPLTLLSTNLVGPSALSLFS